MRKMALEYVYGFPGAGIVWFVGLSVAIHGLLILMALDIASGLLLAGRKKEISSDRSFTGMRKKVMMLLLVAASSAATWIFGLPFDLAVAVSGMFCGTELISIAENAGKLGVPLPKPLVDLLAKLQQTAELPKS